MPSGPASHGGANGAARTARRLAALAFLDVVGYSALMAEDEMGTQARWTRTLAEIIRPASHRYRGTVAKLTGDGVLAEFPSTLDAVEWSREVQHLLHKEAATAAPARPILVRIAVHLGDVTTTDDDIYGDGINVAARLQEHAPPGGIALSGAVHDLVRGNLGRPARDLGLLHLKNYPDPVRAFALDPEAEDAVIAASSPRSHWPSVAVMPLVSLSGNPDDDYFADGIVEDIIVSLAGLRELLVIARGSSLSIARRPLDPREIGRTLGVRYVMTGSVRRSPRQVRVSVQLHDTQTGESLWADASDVPLDALFELQDHIVRRIVSGIAPHVRAAELRRAMRKRPESFTAYDCTLHALNCIHSLNKPVFLQARDYLGRAMAEDPSFAMPVAWAGRWHSLLIGQGWSTDRRADSERAVALAAQAIELDRQNALALATYGHVKSYLFHEYETALAYFDRAISACPNSALAWMLASATLSYIGRTEEAVRHAETAIRLSPFDQNLYVCYSFLMMAHYANGDYDQAVKWGRMSMSENPLYTTTLRVLAATLAALGRDGEAAEIAARMLALEPHFSLAEYDRSLQPFRDPEIRVRFIGDLRRAGLPS